MVVKPWENLVRTKKGAVQPGVKVRGREYTSGSSTAPTTSLRASSHDSATADTGHKRSLAAREYALGLEAVRRAAAGEPLWRIHEAVFGVLALESDAIDPRL